MKTAQPTPPNSADCTGQTQFAEASRASAGESSAARLTLLTAKAVTAPDQAAVAPRLRDQETAERTERTPISKDAPTGPPPAFEESPLERQARVAFDPTEAPVQPAFDLRPDLEFEGAGKAVAWGETDLKTPDAPPDPPPTPSERAEASFAETRTMATQKGPATVDFEL